MGETYAMAVSYVVPRMAFDSSCYSSSTSLGGFMPLAGGGAHCGLTAAAVNQESTEYVCLAKWVQNVHTGLVTKDTVVLDEKLPSARGQLLGASSTSMLPAPRPPTTPVPMGRTGEIPIEDKLEAQRKVAESDAAARAEEA